MPNSSPPKPADTPAGRGLRGRLWIAFVMQTVAIALATLLGVYAAMLVLRDVLIQRALVEEAQHFWLRLDRDPAAALPDTYNMQGYLRAAIPGLPGMALGFAHMDRDGQAILGQAGDMPGFHSLLALFPEQHAGIFIALDGNPSPRLPRRLVDDFGARYVPPLPQLKPPTLATARAHAGQLGLGPDPQAPDLQAVAAADPAQQFAGDLAGLGVRTRPVDRPGVRVPCQQVRDRNPQGDRDRVQRVDRRVAPARLQLRERGLAQPGTPLSWRSWPKSPAS